MNIDENIEKLERKIEHNANKIEFNAKSIEKNSYALSILKDYKEDSKRLFIISRRLFVILIIVLFMWILTLVYLIYILNDTGTIEKTEKVTQENQSGSNNYVGNDGDITNG